MSVAAYQRSLVRHLKSLPPEALSLWMDSAALSDVITALYFGKPSVRTAAVQSLGNRSGDDLDIYLVDVLNHEDDLSVLAALVEVLAKRQTPASVRGMIDCLDRRIGYATAQQIIAALQKYPMDNMVPTLLHILADPVSGNTYRCKHRTVVNVLANTGLPEVFDALVKLAKSTNHRWLLADLGRVISRFDDPRAMPTIVELLEANLPNLRASLESALLDIATPEVLTILALTQRPRNPLRQSRTLPHAPSLGSATCSGQNDPCLPSQYRIYEAIEILKSRDWRSFEAASQFILAQGSEKVYQQLMALVNQPQDALVPKVVTPVWIIDLLGRAGYPAACTVIGRFVSLTSIEGLIAIRALKAIHARWPCLHCESLLQELADTDSNKVWRTKLEQLTHREIVS